MFPFEGGTDEDCVHIFQKEQVNILAIKQQVPVTMAELGTIKDAGGAQAPGSFFSKLHQATVLQEWNSYKCHVLVGAFKGMDQLSIMGKLAYQNDRRSSTHVSASLQQLLLPVRFHL
ncbi:hypothetical protein AAFF_G00368750 [Aldrovandia affinis]|uniref:Uncharacterized protein n=1 Tax=Aldrovandia affinis TaxID=143900 RepID=A0AAD7WMD1_9TELE|nr:hypothetical protein AAFF_G00368750 [Aldrovandia affinis]